MLGYDFLSSMARYPSTMADTLFKKPPDPTQQLLQCEVSLQSSWSEVWDRIQASYATDPKLSLLHQAVQQQPSFHLKYSWHGTFLRRLGKMVVGNDLQLRKHIFELFHNSTVGGHSGIHATRHRVFALLYWKGLSK